MLRSQFCWLVRRVQRIREKQQSIGHLRGFGYEHRCLPSAIGVASEKDTAGSFRLQNRGRAAQTFAVAFRATRSRWPKRPSQPEG